MKSYRSPFPTCLNLFLLACLALLSGCAALKSSDFDQPEIELLGLSPIASEGMEARFRLRLRVVNPNASALSIKGMAYEVYLQDRKVLTGVSDESLRVGAFSESVAELEVAAGMLGSLALLRDLMASPPGESIPYTLKAKLYRGGIGGTIRVNRAGVIELGKLQP